MASQPSRTVPQFTVVDDESEQQPQSQAIDHAAAMLNLALKGLSQRAAVALSSLFTLFLAASVFALFWRVIPDPSTYQLAGLSLYGGFVIAIAFMRRG